MPQVLPLAISKESWRLASKVPAILSLLVFMSDSSLFLLHNLSVLRRTRWVDNGLSQSLGG